MPKEILRCVNCRYAKLEFGDPVENRFRFYCSLYDATYEHDPCTSTCQNHSFYFGKIEMPRFIKE